MKSPHVLNRFHRINFLLPALLLTVFFACKDDPEPDTTPTPPTTPPPTEAQDTTLPTVDFSNLSDGMTVWNTVSVLITAEDDQKLTTVELFIDNTTHTKFTTFTDTPLTASWQTQEIADGTYTLKVVATDGAGNQAQKAITVNVLNAVVSVHIASDQLLAAPGTRGFIFLSNQAGAVVATQEYTNTPGTVLTMNAPDLEDPTFYLSEVVHYPAQPNLDAYTSIYTFVNLNRGTTWHPGKARPRNNPPTATATATMTNCTADATYWIGSDGLTNNETILDANADCNNPSTALDIIQNPGSLFAIRTDNLTYGVFPDITAGNNELDMSLVNTPLVNVPLDIPTTAYNITTRLWAYANGDNTTPGNLIGSFSGRTLSYPGNEFPAYHYDIGFNLGSYYYVGIGKDPSLATIKQFDYTRRMSFDETTGLTYTASGNFDFLHLGVYDYPDGYWAYILPPGENILVPIMTLPAEVASLENVPEASTYYYSMFVDIGGFENYESILDRFKNGPESGIVNLVVSAESSSEIIFAGRSSQNGRTSGPHVSRFGRY